MVPPSEFTLSEPMRPKLQGSGFRVSGFGFLGSYRQGNPKALNKQRGLEFSYILSGSKRNDKF